MPRTLDSEVTATLGVMPGTGTLTPQNAVLIGTADYLAPEQALDFHKADIRSDIYSLGCTFYYLLAGQPPFAGGTLAEKLLKHQQSPPPPLEQFRQDMPAGLTELLAKMLSKRPQQRWQTPAEVALALARISQAQPSTHRRWQKRHLLLGAMLLGLLGLVLFLGLRGTSTGPLKETERPAKDASFTPHQIREFAAPRRGVLHVVAFSPGGVLAATATDTKVDGSHSITVLDTATGTEQFRQPGHKSPVSHLAFSADGRLLASGSVAEKTWKLWDVNRRQELTAETVEAVFHGEDPLVGPFLPDGKHLVVHQRPGSIDLLELDSKKRTSFPFDACAVASSPDGRTLALASRLGRVAIYDVATRKELVAGSPASGIHVYAVAFSPDNKSLAVASWNGEIYVLDAATLKRNAICKEHKVAVLTFAPTGQMLVSGGRDSQVKLWDPATGQLRWTLEGHTKPVRAIAFGRDGRTMLTASDDGAIKVWQIRE
jgi:WD40 repeat protein